MSFTQDDIMTELAEHIQEETDGAVSHFTIAKGELILHTSRESPKKLLIFLRDDPECEFKQLVDICGVDYPQKAERFEVVYNLLSMEQNNRVRVLSSLKHRLHNLWGCRAMLSINYHPVVSCTAKYLHDGRVLKRKLCSNCQATRPQTVFHRPCLFQFPKQNPYPHLCGDIRKQTFDATMRPSLL